MVGNALDLGDWNSLIDPSCSGLSLQKTQDLGKCEHAVDGLLGPNEGLDPFRDVVGGFPDVVCHLWFVYVIDVEETMRRSAE